MKRRRIRWMASGAAVLVVGFSIFLATRDPAGIPTVVEKGDAPEFSVDAVDGTMISYTQLRGKVLYVNFWNTWCKPCQNEEPVLKEFFAAHRDEPDFQMLAIVHQDVRGAVDSWLTANADAGYEVVFDPDERAAEAFGVVGQPESFMLAADGTIVAFQKSEINREGLETMLELARAKS